MKIKPVFSTLPSDVVLPTGRMTTEELRERANHYHDKSTNAIRTSLQYARAAGRALHFIKKRMGHGEWMQWRRENFNGSHKTATKYMRVSGYWKKLQPEVEQFPDFTIEDALGFLNRNKRVPDRTKKRKSYHAILRKELHETFEWIMTLWQADELEVVSTYQGQLEEAMLRLRYSIRAGLGKAEYRSLKQTIRMAS